MDAVKGRLDGKECDAPTLADVHMWLLLFVDDLVLTSESEVRLQQHLDTLQQFCTERGLIVNVEKTKAMVFNSVDPCQEFVFKGDTIERVQTFKYLGILLETTPNLDNAMEHLVAVSRCSLFALNRHCAKLRIMDVKLRYNLFNTLVCSTTSYACEVWVDSKKIEVIEIVYRRFLKFLLGVRKTTSTSIVLVEFGKFPFEHFAWGQALLYYNRVSTITKDHIFGQGMGSPTHYACCKKKMLGYICEKMATQESAQGGGWFSAPDSIVVKNGPSRFPPYNVECKKGEA